MRERTPPIWRAWLFGFSLFLVLSTMAFPHLGESSYVYDASDYFKWRILNQVNLAGEMNVAAWWSACLLLLCGILAYQRSSQDRETRAAWLVLAVAFSALALDEIGSLHERANNVEVLGLSLFGLNDILWLAALVGGAMYFFACWRLWKTESDRRVVILLLVGAALLGSAAVNEYFEHRVAWPTYLVGARTAFEEGLELLGMLVCLMAITAVRQSVDSGDSAGGDRALFLNAARATDLPVVLVSLFVVHACLSWAVINYIEVGFRGDPAVWYPMTMFFVLALSHGWEATEKQHSRPVHHLFLALHFLASSLVVVYFPRTLFMLVQLFVLVPAYLLVRKEDSRKGLLLLVAVVIAVGVSAYARNPLLRYLVLGFQACVIAYLLLPRQTRVAAVAAPAPAYKSADATQAPVVTP